MGEELEDRVKAQMGILKFMQASMYGKMHELSELRVRKWQLKDRSNNEYQIEKKELAENIRSLEINLNKNRLIIENMKENMMEQERIRGKKLKQQTEKLAQVIVKLRKEIPKRKQE